MIFKNFSDKWTQKRILVVALVSLFFLFGLSNWIATSWYSFDKHMSVVFYQGMDYKIIKWWTTFTILDWYEGIITFCVPMGCLLIESLFLYMKKVRPNGWFAHHQASFTWFYMLLGAIWSVGLVVESVIVFLGDTGFGWGFNNEFQADWVYTASAFGVSLTMQLTYLWLAIWFVHWKLAKRENFLIDGYWKRTCVVLFFVLFAYIPVIIFKSGFKRVYYYNIIWGDVLEKLKNDNPERFAHYMQQTKFNYGFNLDFANSVKGDGYWNGSIPNLAISEKIGADLSYVNKSFYNMPIRSDVSYAWWQPYGFFAKNPPLPRGSYPKEDAFPSGHMAATMGIGMTVYIFTGKESELKGFKMGKRIGTVLAILYIFDMMFALQVSLSHWWSDMCFTIMWAVPSFGLAYGTTKLISEKLFPKIHKRLLIQPPLKSKVS